MRLVAPRKAIAPPCTIYPSRQIAAQVAAQPLEGLRSSTQLDTCSNGALDSHHSHSWPNLPIIQEASALQPLYNVGCCSGQVDISKVRKSKFWAVQEFKAFPSCHLISPRSPDSPNPGSPPLILRHQIANRASAVREISND